MDDMDIVDPSCGLVHHVHIVPAVQMSIGCA